MTKQKRKCSWMPTTKTGKTAFWLFVATFVWGGLFMVIPLFGFVKMGVEVALTIFAFVYGFLAIFKAKDRSILLIVGFILGGIVGLFWLLFAGAEIIFPH